MIGKVCTKLIRRHCQCKKVGKLKISAFLVTHSEGVAKEKVLQCDFQLNINIIAFRGLLLFLLKVSSKRVESTTAKRTSATKKPVITVSLELYMLLCA